MKYLFFNALGIGLVCFSNSPRGWVAIFTGLGIFIVGITMYEKGKSAAGKISTTGEKINNKP